MSGTLDAKDSREDLLYATTYVSLFVPKVSRIELSIQRFM